MGSDLFSSLTSDSDLQAHSGELASRRGSGSPQKVTTRGGIPSSQHGLGRRWRAWSSISTFGLGGTTSWGYQFSLRRRLFHPQVFLLTTRCSTSGQPPPLFRSFAKFALEPGVGPWSGWQPCRYCGGRRSTISPGSNKRQSRTRRGGTVARPDLRHGDGLVVDKGSGEGSPCRRHWDQWNRRRRCRSAPVGGDPGNAVFRFAATASLTNEIANSTS